MKNRGKKLSGMLAALCMAALLAGCQGGTEDKGSAAESQTDKTTGTAQETGNQTASPESGMQGETGTYEDGSTPEYSGEKVKLTIDGEEVVIAMYDNTAAGAFIERLPLNDISFSDLSGIEKPAETPGEPFSIENEEPGYDPVTGEMVIYRPWGNFTIFYGDFRYSDELVPLGKVESGLEILSGQNEDFTGTLEMMGEE